jgi:UDP-perosamine 4-acetyltransferase
MKSEIIVVGAGGHAKVCIELLRAMGETVVYCVGAADSPDNCLGVPILRGDENLSLLRAEGYCKVFVAIGSNRLRERLGAFCIEQGYQLVNAISPHAIISPSATLGRGVAVMAGAIINTESVIEDLAIINTGATVDHDCRIGQAAHIAPQCALAGNVTLGAKSFLGIGCKVIPGIRIGERVTVGAGAVVISHVESDAIAVGVPARVLNS